jgi:U-box domain
MMMKNQSHGEIPEEFICPLTLSLMKDPVMVQSGRSFERKAIFEWLGRGNNTDPLTRQELHLHNLVTNYALQTRIQRWKNEQQRLADDLMDSTEVSTDGSDHDNDDDGSIWDEEDYHVLRTLGVFHSSSTIEEMNRVVEQYQQRVERERLIEMLRRIRQHQQQQHEDQQIQQNRSLARFWRRVRRMTTRSTEGTSGSRNNNTSEVRNSGNSISFEQDRIEL